MTWFVVDGKAIGVASNIASIMFISCRVAVVNEFVKLIEASPNQGTFFCIARPLTYIVILLFI